MDLADLIKIAEVLIIPFLAMLVNEIKQLLSIRHRKDVFEGDIGLVIGKLGMWSHAPLRDRLKRVVQTARAKIPYWTVSRDIQTHKTVHFGSRAGWYHAAGTACIPLRVSE